MCNGAASKMERPTFPRNDTDPTDKKATVGMSKVASIGVGEVGEVSERLMPEQVLHVLITVGTDLCADRFAARQLSGRHSSPVPTQPPTIEPTSDSTKFDRWSDWSVCHLGLTSLTQLLKSFSALFVAIGAGIPSGPLCLLIAFLFWATVIFAIAQCRKRDVSNFANGIPADYI